MRTRFLVLAMVWLAGCADPTGPLESQQERLSAEIKGLEARLPVLEERREQVERLTRENHRLRELVAELRARRGL